MAVTAKKEEPAKEEPEKKDDPAPRAEADGDDLEEKIERVLRRLLPQLSGDDKPTAKPRTRAEREVDIEGQVKEQMDKLRADEKTDEERKTILKRMESFEAAIKKEAAPITYGKVIRFFFPSREKAAS